MAEHDEQTPETETAPSGSSRRGRGRGRTSNKATTIQSVAKFRTLVPTNPGIDFVGNAKKGLLLGGSLMLLTVLVMVFNFITTGSVLNFGIDFQGGSSVRLELSSEPDIEAIRGILEDAGYSGSSAVSVPDADNEVLIRVKEVVSITEEEIEACRDALEQMEGAKLVEDGFVHPADSSKIFMKFTAQPSYQEIEQLMNDAGCRGTAEAGVGKQGEFPVDYALIGVGAQISEVLDAEFGEGTVERIVASETVGAKVGSQLRRDGVQAMLVALMGIFLYVMLRFDLRYAPGGIVALSHDAFIVVGAFALTGKEFNLQSIAALLTVIGYSINDTIVVFDRIRERIALDRDAPIRETTNVALNETLSRTVLTSTTTLLVVLAVWVLGTGPIKDFAFALFVGLIAGTFSSLLMATPVFLLINDKMYKGKGHLLDAEGKDGKQRGTGTLLGPQTESPDQGEIAGADSVLGPETGEGPQASADVESALEGETAADQVRERGDKPDSDRVIIADVDKQVTERKTRRRRRKTRD